MSITFYQILHLLGVLLVFSAYGLLIARSFLRGQDVVVRKLGAISSGIGLVLILVSGFGLQARYGFGWPGWFLVKLLVWVVLGGMIVAINRKPQLAMPLYWVTIALGFVAVLMVYMKPF